MRPIFDSFRRGGDLDLPATHRLQLSWLLEAASPAIQYRACIELLPEAQRDGAQVAALREAALKYKPALALARRQNGVTGLWGANLLAPAASRPYGWKEPGVAYQYRRLIELGWPTDYRGFRLADRLLFRLLSRDDDPALLVEFQRSAKGDPGLGVWARRMGREAAAAALARGGHTEDPRLRGAAHRILSDMSQYLRSELAAKPFRKVRGKTVLEPAAYVPTIFAIEMLAFLPTVQRERAGFVERLGEYFSTAATRRAFSILAGKKQFKPMFELLGDPLHADAQGRVSDIPFALYWAELMARLGLARRIPGVSRALARLYNECDDQGVWSPKSLRTRPRSASPLTMHLYPLEGPGHSPAQRQTDVTFRLALIAKILGIPLELV